MSTLTALSQLANDQDDNAIFNADVENSPHNYLYHLRLS